MERKKNTCKTDPDLNLPALGIVQQAMGRSRKQGPELLATKLEKSPAAMTLEQLGGLKGGNARAEKLTPEERAGAISS